MSLVVVGLSHKSAPVEVRERVAIAKDELPDVLRELAAQPSIAEVLCVSTCNRVEVFAAPRAKASLAEVSAEVTALFSARSRGVEGHLYAHAGTPAVRHLFRVAASLDSLVVGEPHILGQVKDALDLAREAGTVGPTLSRALGKALHAAKRVRTETQIGAGLVSVASVAVDLAAQIFGDVHGKTALLVGAGQMAEAAAQLFAVRRAKLLVTNRNRARADELARELGGESRPLESLASALVEADVVVSSTSSPGFVLPRSLVEKAVKQRRGRTLFLIDIAVPRDIDPAVTTLDDVFLYNVDDLEGIVKQSMRGRGAEAEKAETLIDAEVKSFDAWVDARGVIPTLVALRTKVRGTFMAELERSLDGRLGHLGDDERKALETMVDAAVNKLLHPAVTKLKKSASEPRGEELAQVVRELFELPEVSVIAGVDSEPVGREKNG